MSVTMPVLDSPRVEELRRRVDRDPASIAFAALAEEYRRLGRFEEAIATCRAGLLRHPAYTSARVTLGRSLIEVGRFDEAAGELEHVLGIAPENLAAIRALAEIHTRRAEMPDAIDSYDLSGPATVPAASMPDPVTVQCPSVAIHADPPELAVLESFLAAIQRARHGAVDVLPRISR
jgi:tetratricopeptide (TPR) repeat protein